MTESWCTFHRDSALRAARTTDRLCCARKIGQPLLSAPANEPFRCTRHRSFQCGICSCSSSSTATGATPRSNHGKVCCFASSCSTSTFTATGTAAAAAASFQWPLLPAARGDGRDRITRCAAQLAVSAAARTDGTSTTAARTNGTSSSSCSHGRGDRGAAEEGDVAAARRAAARAHAAR